MNQFGLRTPSSKLSLDSSGYLYDPTDTSCDGFPMLQVETMPGTCLGLVLGRDQAKDLESGFDFIKPRTIVSIPNSQNFLVADMGGWGEFKGRLFWLYKNENNQYKLKLLKSELNLPHGLEYPGDGYFYLGEKHQITRFEFSEGNLYNEQIVIEDLPSFEGHMHPLTQFTFNQKTMDLFINYGAPTDHCNLEKNKIQKEDLVYCLEDQEQAHAALYKVDGEAIQNFNGGQKLKPKLIAKGLRNSMALSVSPDGQRLLQAENSRDFEDLGEPYEELNVIDLGETSQVKHYGWPYCFNFNATSPEWQKPYYYPPVDCTQKSKRIMNDSYEPPYILLPPHVAPLGMRYYSSDLLGKEFKNSLLISWHGHQPTGNRLVLYQTDNKGLPILDNGIEETFFKQDQSGRACAKSLPFTPQGGLKRKSNYLELISGWSKKAGIRPEGSPVGFEVSKDGSIWIVEDKARVIVRLAKVDKSLSYKEDCDPSLESNIEEKFELYRNIHEQNPELKRQYQELKEDLIGKYCMGCHGNVQTTFYKNDEYSTLDFLVQNEWFEKGEPEKSKIYGAVAHLEAFTPMPPADKEQPKNSEEGQEAIEKLRSWIENLKN